MALRWFLPLVALVCGGGAICPFRCSCDDETLTATCADAGLEVVPIQLNPDVRRIDLTGNRIDNVHFTLAFYGELRDLDVSRNRIRSLGELNFELQTRLETLNVSDNLIAALGRDVFKGLQALRTLDLSGNDLEVVQGVAFAALPNLVELRLSRNKIVSVGDKVFDHLTDLAALHLEDNQLLDVPTASLRRLTALKTLGLSGNLVESVDEGSFPGTLRNLHVLTLQGNVIRRIHRAAFDGLVALHSLDVGDNNLTTVPTTQLAKLTRLHELDLSGNAFTAVDAVAFQSLFELRRLRLSKLPRLKRIDPRAFVDNIKLESVFLEDNDALERFPTRLFHGNPALLEMSVRGNRLASLDASHFPLDQLHLLWLADNPLHCNCSLLWLWLLARKQEEAPVWGNGSSVSSEAMPRLDLEGIRCAEPDVLRNMLIADVPESAVRCDVSWMAVIIVTVVVTALFAVTCALLLVVGNWKPWHRSAATPEASVPSDKLPAEPPWEQFPPLNGAVKKAAHIVYV